MRSFRDFTASFVIFSKITFLYNHNPYTAERITPLAAKKAKILLNEKIAIMVKNSPTKPLVPGKPILARVKTIKNKANFGITETTPP